MVPCRCPAGIPIPGELEGRYRYWDGTQWSTQLTEDPRGPAPDSDSPARQERRLRRSSRDLVIGLLAGLVIAVAVSALILGNLRSTGQPPLPVPTATGVNDSSPTSRPSSTKALVPCPTGDPDARADHPNDERVYGGNLSFAAQPTFEHFALEPRLSFGYDVVQQTFQVNDNPPWIAQLAVGRLLARDGFVNDPRNTAASVVQCADRQRSLPLVPPQPGVSCRSTSVTVDRHEGWLIESEIRVEQPGLPFPGDRTIVVVVPDGGDWGMFFGAVPIGNTIVNDMLDHAVSSLRAR